MNTFTIILSRFLKNVDIVNNEIKYNINSNNINSNNINSNNINSNNINSNNINSNNINNSYNDYFILKQYDNRNISNKNFTDFIHHKYNILNKYVLTSFFFLDELKDYYFDIFCKSQKIYNILSNTIRKYKIKNSIKFDNKRDLCLNDISDFSEGSIIHIYIDKTRTTYTFRISDIIQIINNALTYSPEFFAEPHYIKNPYTNINFTYSELLHIYFTIKNSGFIMSHFFHQFFLNNFNITNYTYKNESLIREESIKSFVNNSTMLQKYKYIIKMLIEFDDYYSITNIDSNFPKNKLVDVFSFLLSDYLTYEFSLISTLRSISKSNIKCELIKFKKINPSFGRKIIIKKYNYYDNKNGAFEFGKYNGNYIRVYKFIDTINNENKQHIVTRRTNKKPYKKPYKKFKRQQYTYNLDKLFSWKIENVAYKPTLFYTLITKINNNFTKNIKNIIAQYLNVSSFNIIILNDKNIKQNIEHNSNKIDYDKIDYDKIYYDTIASVTEDEVDDDSLDNSDDESDRDESDESNNTTHNIENVRNVSNVSNVIINNTNK